MNGNDKNGSNPCTNSSKPCQTWGQVVTQFEGDDTLYISAGDYSVYTQLSVDDSDAYFSSESNNKIIGDGSSTVLQTLSTFMQLFYFRGIRHWSGYFTFNVATAKLLLSQVGIFFIILEMLLQQILW